MLVNKIIKSLIKTVQINFKYKQPMYTNFKHLQIDYRCLHPHQPSQVNVQDLQIVITDFRIQQIPGMLFQVQELRLQSCSFETVRDDVKCCISSPMLSSLALDCAFDISPLSLYHSDTIGIDAGIISKRADRSLSTESFSSVGSFLASIPVDQVKVQIRKWKTKLRKECMICLYLQLFVIA